MSFYSIYVYIVTILVSRSCYAFMTTSQTLSTLPNFTELYRIQASMPELHLFLRPPHIMYVRRKVYVIQVRKQRAWA